MLSTKEKREMGLILGSVLLVAIVGLIITNLTADRLEAIAGAAVKLNCEIPTKPGALFLLRDHCTTASGTGSCDDICGSEQICLPTQENCNAAVENNQCWCCRKPC